MSSEWREVTLGELLAQPPKNGYSPREVEHWTGTQMLGLGCLTLDGFRPNQLKNAPVGDRQLRDYILADGDLLVSRSNTRDMVGLAGIYRDVGTPCIYPDLMMRLRPNGRMLSSLMIKLLLSRIGRRQIQAAASGTSGSMVKISARTLQTIRLPLPPLSEQRGIAGILDTLDNTIQGMEQVVAKLQSLRLGLLQDLLACGIAENGELRDPGRHPEYFRESTLGRIPRRWSITTLGEVADWLSGGTPSKANPVFWNGHIPWVSPKDMKSFLLKNFQDHISKAGATSGSRLVPAKAVLLVVRGMILAHTFPVCLTTCEVAFSQDIKALVPKADLDGRFLAYWFLAQSEKMLSLVTEATHGTKRIDLKDLKAFPLALPPLDEQLRISELLAVHDERLEREQALQQKLWGIRLGLVDDLLTGRVRVPFSEAATNSTLQASS
jgi:type I restriction enzyme S subunit